MNARGSKRNRRRYKYCRSLLLGALSACPAVAFAEAEAEADQQLASSPAADVGDSTTKGVQEPTTDEAIIITGSRIPRPNLVAPSPITVIDSQEVKYQGTVAIEELLNQLPQVQPSQGLFTSNSATGTATVDLRGLGASRTLVLINGRRLGPGDPTQPNPDLNMIPSTLVKRVEVLTGGASSVYGSDAVSGVVNFILDTKLNGLRIDGQVSLFQHDNNGTPLRAALDDAGIGYPQGSVVDGGRQNLDVAIGKSLFGGRAQVTLYGGYRHVSKLTQDRRDYSACTATISDDDPSLLECGGSFAAFPGNFFTNFDVYQIGQDRSFVPGIDFFNFGPFNFYQREDQRWTGGGFGDFEISRAIHPYVEVMYMRDRSLAQIAPSASFGNIRNINCDNPLLSQQQRDLVCFQGNYVGQRPIFDDDGNVIGFTDPRQFTDPISGQSYLRGVLQVARRGVDTGPRQEDLRHVNLRLLGGIKGDLGRATSYDVSYLRTRAKLSAAHLNDYSASRLRRSVDVVTDPATGQPICRSALIAKLEGPDAPGADPNCVPWDIFALGQVTPEAAAYLSVPSFRQGTVKEQVVNGNATINLGEWGLRSPWSDENPSINVGGEYRTDRLDYEPDERAQLGDLAGSSQDFPVHGSTSVKELFGEMRIPVVTDGLLYGVAFEGGYRQSWYTNGDSKFSTNAYKIALDIAPVRGLRIRGSQQRAVRAPNLVELFYPPQLNGFQFDRCAGVHPQATLAECQATGVTAAQYGTILEIPNQGGFASYNSTFGGNPDLLPEMAKTRTLGLVLEPRFLPGFNATLDAWNINLKGAIGYVDAQTILDTCLATADPLFCSRIHRDAEGSLWLSEQGFIDERLANIASFKLRGIDAAVNYQRSLGTLGAVNASFVGTYIDRWQVDNGGLSVPFDCAGKYGGVCGTPTPRWRHKARLTWSPRSGASVSINWRYTGSMKLQPFDDAPASPLTAKLPSQSFFDLSGIIALKDEYTLRMGINNLFDRKPPLLAAGNGACTGGCNGNTLPQFYDPLGRFVFIGVTVNSKPF